MKNEKPSVPGRVQSVLLKAAEWIEILIACLVVVGVCFDLTDVAARIRLIDTEGLSSFLQYLIDILIGLELVKVLCKTELDAIVEILLFAVTKYLIIEHLAVTDILVGILAIAALFAVRKYLFIPKDRRQDSPAQIPVGQERSGG